MSRAPRPTFRVDLDAPDRIAAASRLVPSRQSPALSRICAVAAELVGTSSAQVSLLTEQQHVAGGVGAATTSIEGTPRADSLCTLPVRSAAPYATGDAPHDPHVQQLPPVASGAVSSYLGVPLSDVDGQVVGALCVYGPRTRSWEPEQVRLLEGLALAVVAELERAAVELERDLAQFRLGVAIAAGGIGTWEWDVRTGLLHIDERAMAMFGFPVGPGSLTLAEVERRVHPEDVQSFVPALRRAVADGVDYSHEFRMVGADGRVRWLVARGRPLRDGSGVTVRVVGAMYESTEQHEAAASASASADLVSLLAAASDLLSGSLDPEHAVRSLARVVVPRLADWCLVSLLGEDGVLRDVESWHADPDQRELTAHFARYRFAGREDPVGSLSTFAGGEPFVLETGVREFASQTLRSAEAAEALERLDIASTAVLPLLADDQVIGLITLARGHDRPPLDDAELSTAVDLSRRASTALAIARAYGLEREMSEGLQRSLLTEPVASENVEVAVRYVPASAAAQVGGDWYDAFTQPDGSTMLVVGDVVGHDTEAAAGMGQLRNLLRGIAVASGESPGRVLERVDHAIDTLRVATTASAVLARVEQDEVERHRGATRLHWSNAGHPPAVVLQPDGSTHRLEAHDLLLGVVPGTDRRESAILLEPGATVLMFTDGLVERRGEDLHDGVARLERLVAGLQHLSVQALADELVADLVPDAPEDDIALLAVRVRPVG